MHEAHAEVVRALYEAFSRRDFAGILDALHDDVEWGVSSVDGVPWTGARRGKADVLGFFATLATTVDIELFRPELFVSQGDHVAVTVRIEFLVQRNGRRVTTDSAHLWTFRDGRIARFQAFDDTAAFAEGWKA